MVLGAAFAVFATTPKNASQLFNAAKVQDDAQRFDIALSLYLKADSAFVAEKLGNTPEYAQSLHNTGRAYFNTGNMAEGRNYTLKAAELREKLFGKVSKEYITSLNNYALSYLLAEDLQNALKYQTEVIDLCHKMNPSHPDEGMYIINLGRIYHSLNNDAEAIKLMEEAMPKVEKFGTDYEYILNFLGKAYMDNNDNANVNRILGLMDEHNRHELEKECNEPECMLDRAEYFSASGDAAKAKELYMKVFTMDLTNSQKANACEKYARFLSNQRDFSQAGDYYAMASELNEKVNGISENSVSQLRQAGLCYFVGREYSKAIDAHTKVISAVDKYGYSEKLKSTSLQGLGNAYSAIKDYDNAIASFQKWIRHLKLNGHETEADYAKAYERLASAEKFKGDYNASLADYDTAINLYDKLGMHDEKQQASNGKSLCLAYAKKDMGDISVGEEAQNQRNEKIRKTLQSSLDNLEQSGDYLGKLSKAQSLATIAGLYSELGDYENAIKYYGQYIPTVREALAEDFLLKSPKERELTWKQELGNISTMNALITLLPQNPTLYSQLSNLIYEGQLLSKGILLSSDIEFEKILDKKGTPEMKTQFATIKKNLEQIEKMKQERRPKEEIMALTRETDALQLALSKESSKYGDFMSYLHICASDVLKSLGDNAGAIEFVTLDTDPLDDQDMVVAVVLSKEYPTGMVLPINFVKYVKNMIAANDKFIDDTYGSAIWGNILKAFANKNTIYFAPDGLLNNVGIEYFSVNGKPLSEQINISRLSSTREIARDHTLQPLKYASLFGGIDYLEEGKEASKKRNFTKNRGSEGVSFSTLENTKREVDEIYSILKKNTKKTFEYTGVKASKPEFLSQDVIDPLGILHVATHGKYIVEDKAKDSDAMNNSVLALAGANLYTDYKHNEGIVTAAEIAKMSLQDCELAVLSACESGLGKLADDGVFGLQRGFKNAGVKSLLVSLNEVADASTADMMIAFYRNLFNGEGLSKREAFRKAQAEIRSKYPNDPTWASFILIDSFN